MPIPVITCAQMRQWEEASWDAGLTEDWVIQQVGRAVGKQVCRRTRPGDRVLVLAGRGHNGGDALQSVRAIEERHVAVIHVTDPGEALAQIETELGIAPDLIVDGLFGIGLNRPLDLPWRQLIERVNAAKLPVLAIDTPSGLNATTGEPEGAAIEATWTLAVGAPKAGLLPQSAWPFVGHLDVLADIGLAPFPLESELQWTVASDFKGFPPPRKVSGHKGTYGHVGILAGSTGYHGAAILAAQGALRARPGLVTVITLEQTYLPVASQLRLPMVHPWSAEVSFPESTTAILCGPGLASPTVPSAVKAEVRHLWQKESRAVVVDASALQWLEPGGQAAPGIRVITPHPGEAAALLGCASADVQSDRPGAVRRLSKKFGGCWVVLKGHQTVIGQESGPLHINSTGNPYLAQGGAGDLLAGFITGFLAQTGGADPLLPLRYAVHEHGAAADALSSNSGAWTVDELVLALNSRGNFPFASGTASAI